MLRRLFICFMAISMICFPVTGKTDAAQQDKSSVALTSTSLESNNDLASATVTGSVYDFVCTGRTETTATFQWTAAGSGVTDIVIEQSPAGQNSWTPAQTGIIATDANTATVNELTAGTVYDFRLMVTGGTNAGTSNTVSIKTDIDVISKLINGGHLFDWNPGDGTVYSDLPYGDKESNKYDLYIPTNASKTDDIGVILYVHGGSWTGGDKSGETADPKRYAQAGYIVASMNYTVVKDANGATIKSMEDEIEACVAALKQELTSRGYHVSRMTMAGYSAGGHLASLFAYSRAEVSALPVVLLLDSVGPSDMHPDTWIPISDATSTAAILSLMVDEPVTVEDIESGRAEEKIKSVSPLQHVSSTSPPTVMAYAAYDQIVAPGHPRKLAAALAQAGVDYKYILYPNSDHFLGNDPDKTAERISTSLAYLHKYMSPVPLSPIADFTNTATTTTSASFSWSAPVRADKIVIEQSLAGKNLWTKATTEAIEKNAASATVTGLMPGTVYDFRLVVTGGVNTGESNTVRITTNVNTPTSTPTSTPQVPASGNSNEQSSDFGTTKTIVQNDQTVETLLVDLKKLTDYLSSKGEGAVVSIPMVTNSDTFSVVLSGQMILAMENKKAVMEVQTERATYRLPAKLINISAVSGQLGDSNSMNDLKVQIEISAAAAEKSKLLETAAQKDGFSIIVSPVNFMVKASRGEKSIEVSNFNEYVERTLTLPDNVSPEKVMTGVTVDEDGAVRPVPTKIMNMNGKHYAQIKSMTNSAYSVIWHMPEFNDTANHWAGKAINEMASRMVIPGTDRTHFSPNSIVTGTEFTTALARGLGLQTLEGTAALQDITFLPNKPITREQAMVIINRAMDATGLIKKISVDPNVSVLKRYSDAGKVSSRAEDAVVFCLNSGIVNGRSKSLLAVDDFITRAEIAVIMQRVLEKSGLL
ncbi:fibronectin type III domain-containing protein [Paenibacillus sp. HN-1]|uniref:S-layer homology domain-containing protein n=1 Tax=Paenibacillus TaxID=44249 RepID=UPI001CA9539A|nr:MULTISPECIES: S-layer homology domain-containing protein [Paenibacillus]MBY9078352.1 fibronectin type III domain-containing protein [Paenibacillus sp. CGMCC 1.18879]MBY9083164.1 fibronectin type III domain-containing protein [Paenibacillus sinensis]